MTQTSFALVILVIGIIVVAAITILFVRRNRRSSKRGFQALSRMIGTEALMDFVIPNGTDGEIHIDTLLLTDQGLILLDTKDMVGTVFAGDRMDTWSATDAGKRLTFANPIPLLQERVAAVSLIAPGVPIESRILFTNQATFPKGHPPEVATIQELIEEYDSHAKDLTPQDFSAQWQAICSVAATG